MNPVPDNRCTLTYRDGRRCRMLTSGEHPALCLYHHRRASSKEGKVPLAASVLAAPGALDTRRAVRRSLKHVVRDVATGRLAPEDARVLAELGRLLLVYTRRTRKPAPARRRIAA